MQLDKVAAELRPRKGVESIDLGVLLGRRFWWAIMAPWLLLVVPILVVVGVLVAVLTGPSVWVVLAGWWLKPLFDRVTLMVVSRGFFGDVPSAKSTVRTVLKSWFTLDALLDLTVRRLSPVRSLVMPIRVLEKSRGKQARARSRSLYGGIFPFNGLILMGLMGAIKWVFYLAVLLLLIMVLPSEMMVDEYAMLDYLFNEFGSWTQVVALVAVTTLATTLVEPFYAAGGFGIYIQRRVEREGWDLELRFRRLVDRVQAHTDAHLAVLLAVGLSCVVAVSVSDIQPANAHGPMSIAVDGDDEDQDRDDDTMRPQAVNHDLIPVDDVQSEFDEMMGQPPFARRSETRTNWVPIDDGEEEEEWDPFADFDPELPGLEWLAFLLRIAMWILALMAVAAALWKAYTYVKSRRIGGDQTPREARWAQELADGDEDLILPDENIGQAVRDCWNSGGQRRALALLLLGSLVKFEERFDFRFSPGWTTSRCAREVREHGVEGAVLADVAEVFGALAWADTPVREETFLTLLKRWESAFERSGGQR